MVPYTIANSFSSKERGVIAKAMRSYKDNTCIRVINKLINRKHIMLSLTFERLANFLSVCSKDKPKGFHPHHEGQRVQQLRREMWEQATGLKTNCLQAWFDILNWDLDNWTWENNSWIYGRCPWEMAAFTLASSSTSWCTPWGSGTSRAERTGTVVGMHFSCLLWFCTHPQPHTG